MNVVSHTLFDRVGELHYLLQLMCDRPLESLIAVCHVRISFIIRPKCVVVYSISKYIMLQYVHKNRLAGSSLVDDFFVIGCKRSFFVILHEAQRDMRSDNALRLLGRFHSRFKGRFHEYTVVVVRRLFSRASACFRGALWWVLENCRQLDSFVQRLL